MEAVEKFADTLPERLNRAFLRLAKMGFELREGLLDRIEAGRDRAAALYGGLVELFMGRVTHPFADRLSRLRDWTFINEPFAAANVLAYAAAFLVTSFVLVINILSRFVLGRRRS